MSRIGRKPIVIPAGVEVKVDAAEHAITVKGPKGTLHSKFHPLMTVAVEGNEILVTRPNDEKEARSRRMTAAVEEIRAAEAAAMQGRKASVLLETPLSATMFTGYTKQYLPVLVSAPGHKTGDIVEVTLGAWDGKRCRAEIV